MKITEGSLRRLVRQVITEQAEGIQSPEYTQKREQRQALLAQFKTDRDAAMARPFVRGKGFTPAERKKAYEHGEMLQGLAEDLVNVIEPAYDEVKQRLDDAFRQKDLAAFEEGLEALRWDVIARHKISTKTQRAQGPRKLFRFDRELQRELASSLKKILDARDQAEKWLVNQKRTPAERERAAAASQRMRAAWGSI